MLALCLTKWIDNFRSLVLSLLDILLEHNFSLLSFKYFPGHCLYPGGYAGVHTYNTGMFDTYVVGT